MEQISFGGSNWSIYWHYLAVIYCGYCPYSKYFGARYCGFFQYSQFVLLILPVFADFRHSVLAHTAVLPVLAVLDRVYRCI